MCQLRERTIPNNKLQEKENYSKNMSLFVHVLPTTWNFSAKSFWYITKFEGEGEGKKKQIIWNNIWAGKLIIQVSMAFSPSVSVGPSECLPNYYLSFVMRSGNSLE